MQVGIERIKDAGGGAYFVTPDGVVFNTEAAAQGYVRSHTGVTKDHGTGKYLAADGRAFDKFGEAHAYARSNRGPVPVIDSAPDDSMAEDLPLPRGVASRAAPQRPAPSAVAAAVKAERERMSAIYALPEAVGREAAASDCVARGVTVEQARAELGAARPENKFMSVAESYEHYNAIMRNGGKPETLDAVYARRSAIYSGASGKPAVNGKQPERLMTTQESYDLYNARMAGDSDPWSAEKCYAFRAGIFNAGGQR